jgi:hypothetical protein
MDCLVGVTMNAPSHGQVELCTMWAHDPRASSGGGESRGWVPQHR